MRVTVVGAGVIGLSCAWRLVERGHEVRLVADREPHETTSAVAAAIWYPYLAEPRERVVGWGATTYAVLGELAQHHHSAGVRMLPGVERFDVVQPDPWWATAVPDLVRVPDGWTFTAPVVDMPVYLAWLRARLAAAGVALGVRRVNDLDDELADSDAAVNCTGLGSRELLDDHLVTPVRGQVVIMTNPGLSSWWLYDASPTELTYVVPRLETVVVGGTAEPGRRDRIPDRATAGAILARANALVPALEGATVLRHDVGLRPARATVRLEREQRPRGAVVHCYGHGGAGVTLSWGCAEEVAELLEPSTRSRSAR